MTSTPRLTWVPVTLQLRDPFRISYGVSETRRASWLRLSDDAGWGEGTIPSYYGIGEDEMRAVWQQAAQRQDPFPDTPADIPSWIGEGGPAPARCALDLALHDRIGRNQNLPLFKLLALPAPRSLATSFTISIDTPEATAAKARQIAHYPIIKVKLGSDHDVACIAAIRDSRPDVKIRIDANAAWSPEEAVRRIEALAPYDLELVEQPTPRSDIAGMGFVQARTDIPVVADESVQTIADVEALAEAGVQGINFKLMKVGGISPAVKMLKRAQELGIRIMLGCMVETSLGVTAMAHLSGFAEWLDLDAPLLIANDPFVGLRYNDRNVIGIPQFPGIGVVLEKTGSHTGA